jgi:hypothetical protein
MLLMASYLLERNRSFTAINFVTCNGILRDQLRQDITAMCPKEYRFNFCSVLEPDSIGPADVFFIDEADETLKHLVTFASSPLRLNGLYHCKGKLTYLFTATMPSMFKITAEAALGITSYNAFITQYMLSTNSAEPFNIKLINAASPAIQINNFLAELSTLVSQKQPVIVFCTNQQRDLELEASLLSVAAEGYPPITLFEDGDLLNTRASIEGMSQGILVVSMKYARGTNLKF